jgi:hypothetical protein
MSEQRGFEARIDPAIIRISELLYGQNLPILGFASVVVVPNDIDANLDMPKMVLTEHGPQLQLSHNGSKEWEDKLGEPCSRVGVAPPELYIGSGIAQLELVTAAQSSLDGDLDVLPRVVRTKKMLDAEGPPRQQAATISELTEISVKDILAGFDYSEFIKLNMLRYGIGIALRSHGLQPKEINQFAAEAKKEAVSSLNNYFMSAAEYLAIHAFSKSDSIDKVGELLALEPPFIEIAASAPMNTTYLLENR